MGSQYNEAGVSLVNLWTWYVLWGVGRL